LPGTAEEAQALKALFPGAEFLTSKRAKESSLKRAFAPRILHIATHGFFLESQQPPAREDRLLRPMSNGEPPVGPIENPLLRSGLALAGANLRKGSDEDDGILTAQEAAGLNLWGTKLVVLSACDTGVGEVKSGEGVYGLRRALVLAGSETQVMSLWPVSDKGTRDLMIEYYRRLLRGEGRSAALRAVQLQMLKAKATADDEENRLLVTKNQ
jgi:CHAT domain-containing protein